MKKISKLIGSLALGFMVLGVSKVASAAVTQDTAFTGNQSSSITLQNLRGAGANAAGRQISGVSEEIGWNVFEDSGAATLALVKDSKNVAPTCGILHKICVDESSTNFGVAYDSSSTNGLTLGVSAGAIGGKTFATSTASVCTLLDAKFENGLVVGMKDNSSTAYFLWGPCIRAAK